jgi:hypothetical protein
MATDEVIEGRAKGGVARANALTPEQRKEISRKAADAKKAKSLLPRATHGKDDHPLRIGNIEIPCYVLEDGKRVLAQRGMVSALGMARGGSSKGGGDRLAHFIGGKALEPFINNDLKMAINSPIQFVTPTGLVANCYDAQMLVDICEAVLSARQEGRLQKQQHHIAMQCEILMRGLARVGIIALVDEATGYQKDRARDALAKILEAYVAKELQPYVRTFESAYYEHMFRLRGLPYPPDSSSSKPQYRPQYFGKLTNDIVYRRLAPGVLEALKDEAKKESKRTHLHRHLTAGYGRLELIKHLAIVTLLMKRAKDWQEFMIELNKEAPRYGDTYQIDLDEIDR